MAEVSLAMGRELYQEMNQLLLRETRMESASFPTMSPERAGKSCVSAPTSSGILPLLLCLYKDALRPKGATITSTLWPESRRGLGPRRANASCLSLLGSWPRTASRLLPTSI